MDLETSPPHGQDGMQSRRACHQCNRKKVRCDMQRPQCALCLRVGILCTFPTKRKSPQIRKSLKTPPISNNFERVRRLVSTLGPELQTDQTLRAPLASSHSAGQTESSPTEEGRRSVSSPSQELYPPETEGGHDQALDTETFLHNSHENCPKSQVSAPVLPRSKTNRTHNSPSDPQSMHQEYLSADLLSPEVERELIDIYFTKIQAWLPLLHHPRFYKKYFHMAQDQKLDLTALSVEERLLFKCIFALAARHSNSSVFAGTDRLEHGHKFAEEANALYELARGSVDPPNLLYLQGCILLAFYWYTSGPCAKGWILSGVCVRLAYDLDLSGVDDEDSEELDTEEWVRREELRRAFWLVWELDTFGSTVSIRPYSIDRRRISVRLPVSDEAWFAERPVSSGRLDADPSRAWRSLQNCENQDERAWFLITNFLMSILHDLTNRREGLSSDERLELENAFNCFKLSLPSTFNLETGTFAFDAQGFARSNWIMSTHLMLAGCDITISSLSAVAASPLPQHSSLARVSQLQSRAAKISRIISRWSPEFVSLAHPFIACSMLPIHIPGDEHGQVQPKFWSHHLEVVKLILYRFAEIWKLGTVLLNLANLLEKPHEMNPKDFEIARRFAVFFPPAMRNKKRRTVSLASTGDGREMARKHQKYDPNSSCAVVEGAKTPHFRENELECAAHTGQNWMNNDLMAFMPTDNTQDLRFQNMDQTIQAPVSTTGDQTYLTSDPLEWQNPSANWNLDMLEFFGRHENIDFLEFQPFMNRKL